MRLRRITVVAVFAVLVSLGSVAQAQNHAQHYVLDAFGGVHAAGGAPVITPATPYFGFDVAANIEYVAVGTSVAVGDGYIVLDKWGGVHYGGALAADPPSGAPTPYFGFDAARSVVRRDVPSRIGWSTLTSDVFFDTATTSFTTLTTATITAPVDGLLYVTGSAAIFCEQLVGPSDNLVAWLSVGVDETSGTAGGFQGAATWDVCDGVAPVAESRPQTVIAVVPVTAGNHSVHLLGRKDGGAGRALFTESATVVALFIAQDSLGQMSMAGGPAAPAAALSLPRSSR